MSDLKTNGAIPSALPLTNGTISKATMQAVVAAVAVTMIDIRLLYSEDATRLNRSEEHINALAADFKRRLKEHPGEHPVQTPLRVVPREDRFLIVAGNNRYAAGLRIPLDVLPCIILPHELTGIELFIEQHRDNAMQEGYSPVEKARNILHVKDQTGCTQAEAGLRLGVDNASDVTKMLSVLKRFPEDLLDQIGEGEGKIPFTSAYALSRLDDVPTIRDLADKVRQGNLTRDGAERRVQTILGTKKGKKEKPYKITIGGVVMVIKGKVTEQIRNLIAKCQDALKRGEKDNLPDEVIVALLKA